MINSVKSNNNRLQAGFGMSNTVRKASEPVKKAIQEETANGGLIASALRALKKAFSSSKSAGSAVESAERAGGYIA